MIESTLPNKPQSYIELFKTSFRMSKHTFIKNLPLFILVFVGSYGFLETENWIVAYKKMDLNSVIASLLLLVFFIICYAAIGGVIYRMNGLIKQQDPGFVQSFKIGFKKIIPLIVVSVLYTLSIVLGLILFIIPGIMVSIYFVFSIYLIYQNFGMIASFKESYGLVKDHWWRTAINIFLASLFVFLVVILVNILMLASLDVKDMLIKPIYTLPSYFFDGFIRGLAYLLLMMVYNFSIAFMLNCIHDLRIRKQNPF